jgi:hypothetical protein
VASASEISDAASRAGVTATESFQRVKFAVEQGGGSVEALGAAFKTMSGHLVDGDKGTVAALADLGLKLEDLRQMSPDQAFTAIADAIAKVPEPMRQSALAVDLFGKSGDTLLPAIKAGITEIGNAAPVMRAQTVKALEEAGDQWEATQQRLQNLKAEALAPVLETFLKLPPALQTVAGGISAFAPSLETLVLGLMAIGGPTGAMAALSSAGALLVTFFTVTLPAAFSAILPFLGPIGLIAAGVTAVVVVWKNWETISGFVTGVYDSVKTWLVDNFAPLVTSIGTHVGAVVRSFVDMHVEVVKIVAAVYTAAKEWLVDKFAVVVKWIGEKVGMVTGFFKDMWDKVAAHSYVPDMLTVIADSFAQLDAVMVNPAKKATTDVSEAFEELAEDQQASTSAMTGATTSWLGQTAGVFGTLGRKYKAFAIAEAIIATYMSIAKTLATTPWPFNLVLAAGAAAAGFANVAAIRASDTPAFAAGGLVTRPTLLTGLFGEAGPEAILPLSRLRALLGERGGAEQTSVVEAINGLRQDLLRSQALLELRVRDHMLLAGV